MRGINVDIIKGYYTEVPSDEFAACVNDPDGLLIDDIRRLNRTADDTLEPGRLSMRMTEFEHQIRGRVVPGVSVALNFATEDDIISSVNEIGNLDVGYVFLRASLQELQAFQPHQAIYVRLLAPQNHMTFITICPRKLMNSIFGDIYPGMVFRHLISIPHPVNPGDIMITPYFQEGTVKACSYDLSNMVEPLRWDYGGINTKRYKSTGGESM